MQSGSVQYNMGVTAGPTQSAFPVPDPVPPGYWNNADNGAHGGTDDGTPVDNQPKNSFNAINASGLEPNDNVMTIWNGTIQSMNYTAQPSLVTSDANTQTQLRVKLLASKDSVLLSWGGHIASRLDWGNFPGTTTPRSAGGISGSPYHMALLQLFVYNGTPIGNKTCKSDSCEIGLGNQDRSLSAAAVFPPPGCPTATSVSQCYENKTFSYTLSNTEAGVTYNWSFETNTVGATFQGGGTTATGTSVTVVANPGADVQGVDNGGSFTLKLTAVKNGITTECTNVATGTLIDVDVDAQDADNTLQINLNSAVSTTLGIQSISPGTTADYTFLWKIVSVPTGGSASFSSTTSSSPTFTINSPYATGNYVVRVIATQTASTACKDSSDVTIEVSGGVTCGINGPATVCPGSQDNLYYYDPDNDLDADPLPTGFTAQWSFDGTHPSAEFDGSTTGNTVKVDVAALGSSCNTTYKVKLTLTAVPPGITQISCGPITVSVEDKEAPVITDCPDDVTVACGASTLPADLPAGSKNPTFTDNCSATADYSDATVSNCNRTVITRTWTVTDICGNTAICQQTITTTDTQAPTIQCPANKTGANALTCGASILPANTGTPTVSDNCSATGDIIVYYKDAPQTNVPCGTILRTWYAVDKAGNSNSCTQTIEFVSASTLTQRSSSTTAIVETSAKKAPQSVKQAEIPTTLNVNAFPNPFTNEVIFRFTSPVTGKARLEVHTMLGQNLGVAFEGLVKAGQMYDIKYNAKGGKRSTLLYSLKINDKIANGKLFRK
jgi:hypothetical protein